MRLTLVIPSFDEADSLPTLLVALDDSRRDLLDRGYEVETIIVDDGSTDRSPELLREATRSRPWLRVIRLARNFGQTAALAAGIRAATGEVLITLDADLQNDPADIPALLSRLDGHDVVSGWRRHRQDDLTRTFASRLANWLIGRVTGVRLHDIGCTLKAYRREALEGVTLLGEMHRILPVWVAMQGGRITEQEVRHHRRAHGRSHYGLGRIPNVLLDLILARLFWRYGTKPMHLFGKLGLAAFAAAFSAVVAMLWLHLKGTHSLTTTPLPSIATLFFLGGCFSILQGFLAELLTRTYFEASGRTTYSIREEYRDGTSVRGRETPSVVALAERR